MSIWYYSLLAAFIVYSSVCVIFYFYQESFLFHPRKTAQDFTYKFDYPFTELFYNTPHNGRIHALHFKAPKSKGLVFYLHGNAGSLRDWGWVYKDFWLKDYDVLILDYRSYGKSTGQLSERNMHSDVAYVYDQIKADYDESDIVVYGRSIGTGMASKLAAERKPRALVLETPYYSIKDIAKRIAPVFPLDLLLKYKFKSYKFVQQVDCPIHIIHGTNDNVVPYASGYKLYESVKNKAALYTVSEGQHNDLPKFKEFKDMLAIVLD